jgi:hypothetical protein
MTGPILSVVENALSTVTQDCSCERVIDAIRMGGKKLRALVEEIRRIYQRELAVHKDREKAKRAVSFKKQQLTGVMWSGRFSQRKNDCLIQHSGLLSADLDSLSESLSAVREKLKGSRFLFALFLSPSGDGLKAVFRVSADASVHEASFRAVERHVFELTGVKIDQSCKDLARLCFMSWDPDIYVNWNAIPIEPLPLPEKPKHGHANGDLPPDLSLRERIATELLGHLRWSAEKGGYFCKCPGEANHTNSTAEKHTIVYLDSAPTLDCQHNSCAKIVEAINAQLRSLIGKAEYQNKPGTPRTKTRTAEERDPADRDSAELTSLSSPGAAEYPAPPDDAAYYGLAGDIVRRIESHTEADPVALLVQILVAFGNVIGRNAHAIADGSQHYTNLNTVLVGETSKGRKGTALQHVLRLFAFVAEDWLKRIANGLSSGEGLIWAVRDPMKEKKPVKKNGRVIDYETVVVDDGVLDKRLLVVESEYANVLKVMTREGNTLSPVIRSAWESGNLRILTKNSPAQATDAHISMIGHITREELRRLLTETESANGFGNRNLYFAVRRSKYLPEGGEVPPVADLVERLQEAVEFAKHAGELRRSKEAQELWASVYPKLSEGKPGLLGAITARAEAQVLRLSETYALLDCSSVVRVEHLKAALACGRYSEDSAKWIFETGTGNKNADKILAALTVAAEKGLTKLEITCNVFNRHATRFEIDEALRLLFSLKLADRIDESTGGRPAERWFYKAGGAKYAKNLTPETKKREILRIIRSLRLQKNVSRQSPALRPASRKVGPFREI